MTWNRMVQAVLQGTARLWSRVRHGLGQVVPALRELGGLALPVACAGCGEGEVALCETCLEGLAGPVRPVRVAPGLRGRAAAAYSGRVRHVVLAWKDGGRHDVTRALGAALGRAVLALLAEPLPHLPDPALRRTAGRAGPASGGDGGPPSGARRRRDRLRGTFALPGSIVLVPVPSRRAARRRRGADLVRRLARAAARRVRAWGVEVRVVPALQLRRPVADQAGLGRAGRQGNLAGAMRVRVGARAAVVGRLCVIVDDVITTGATVREAARALAAAGGLPVGAAAACATPLRGGLSGSAHLD